MSEFCKYLTNGLVYNNDTTTFTVSPCCYYNRKSKLTDITTATDQLKQYRINWIQSDTAKTCKICLDMEDSGSYSYRQSSFDVATESDKIQMLTVAVNKQCNLACPSCGSHSSSFWYQENLRNKIVESENIHNLHRLDRNKNSTQDFVRVFEQLDLSELKYIKFGGGEPLMSDVHLRIMELIPNPNNVVVHYTSNFTIMPSDRILKCWEKFKLIKWLASLDGVDTQFEFLRWPACWDQIQKNILRSKIAVPHNVQFGVEHTLNPLNIFYYDKFESWFQNNFQTNRYGDLNDFNLHPCDGIMSLTNTPPALRDIIKNKYSKNHLLVLLLDKYPWSGDYAQLVSYLDNLNTVRNQNWRNVFTEIQGYFD